MTKDLIEVMSEAAGITKKQALSAADALFESIVKSVTAGEEVSFKGFGKFYPQKRGERMGRNPKTKVPMKIAARVIPKFKAGRDFKSTVREAQ